MKTLHTLSRIPEQHQHTGLIIEEEISEDGLPVTEEEYWEKYYQHPDVNSDFNYEWNNGYLEVKPMSDLKGSLMYQWFSDIMRNYFSTYPIGKIINLDIGFRLAFSGSKSVRKPDFGIVLNDNRVTMHHDDNKYKGIFDLCVESLSYSSSKEVKRDTVDKKKEYEGVGVTEYYILDARGKETAFYRLNKKGIYQKIKPINKEIIKSEVLPGFQFKISDLYRQPSLKEMAEDELYQGYVLPFYHKVRQEAEQERRRAENAEQRAEIEKQRAEQEMKRAEQLARKLKELGIEL